MTSLKVQIEQTIYEGTAAEIMDRLRKETFDPTEFPDTESFLWFLRSNAIRMTGIDCPLPDADVETQAQTMLRHLARIGGLRILEE